MKTWKQIVWRQALPRIFADVVMVHLAAIASLATAALWQIYEAQAERAPQVIAELHRFYLHSFLPLSAIFPLAFLVCGFYTRSRSYPLRHKWLTLARGATAATLLFLFANFLVTRADSLPRSAMLLFIVLVNALTIGARILKSWLIPPLLKPAAISTNDRAGRPVLVVGGAGYIGSILCRQLLSQGRRVRLLDNFVYGNSAVRELFGHPGFELSVGDCRNIQNVVSAVNGAGSIIHLAAIVGDPACEQDKRAALEINYAATRMMIEVAKGYGVDRFLFASSCSVYGATEEVVDEKSAASPISLYAQTKVDSEQALLQASSDRFHPTILRLATVFGNSCRPRFDLVVNLLTAKALKERMITIYNGEQWRPFLHVMDAAAGFVRALEAPLAVVSAEIFNLGDSRMNYTLAQVAEIIGRMIPGTRVEHVENPDRRNYRVSFGKIRRELGFQCKVSIEEGIRDLKSALETRQIPDFSDPLYHNQRFLKAAGCLGSTEEIDAQVMAAFALALENQQHELATVALRSS
ncbi:MAG: NAD-dependent epimerase/dehydratase family protein [Acidobacteria bacterium]|nr:NAD-dependent epimerase/dehydratase family protein [Acidobacteriota bacterium]